MILLWPISIFFLIKGTEIFWKGIEGSKHFAWMGGALLLAIVTSLPKLFFSLSAAMFGLSEMAVATAVGSNIFNIFLVVGLIACVHKQISFPLISRHLSILVLATIIFLGVIWHNPTQITQSWILILFYIPLILWFPRQQMEEKPACWRKAVGGALLIIFSSFLLVWVAAVTFHLAEYGVIAVTLLAFIVSLPGALLAWQAIQRGNPTLALRSVVGSNVFNILLAIGLPGLFYPLLVSPIILNFAIPAMALATLLFVVAGLSRRLYRWEGFVYVLFYIIFIWKIYENIN
jgi:cation:H+ antiporter